MNEKCRLCTETEPNVWPDDDIALCRVHWARWVSTYVNSDYAAPCSAHLIEDEQP